MDTRDARRRDARGRSLDAARDPAEVAARIVADLSRRRSASPSGSRLEVRRGARERGVSALAPATWPRRGRARARGCSHVDPARGPLARRDACATCRALLRAGRPARRERRGHAAGARSPARPPRRAARGAPGGAAERRTGSGRRCSSAPATGAQRTEDRPPPPRARGRRPASRFGRRGRRRRSRPSWSRVEPVAAARRAALRSRRRRAVGGALSGSAGRCSTRTCAAPLRAVARADARTRAGRWAVEMPSAGRAARAGRCCARCATRGVGVATLTHAAGLSSTGDAALDAALPLPERYDVPERDRRGSRRGRARAGGRVVAVGTTVVRALEGAASASGRAAAGARHRPTCGSAPGFRPRVVDGSAHRPARARRRATSSCCRRSRRAPLLEAALAHARARGLPRPRVRRLEPDPGRVESRHPCRSRRARGSGPTRSSRLSARSGLEAVLAAMVRAVEGL